MDLEHFIDFIIEKRDEARGSIAEAEDDIITSVYETGRFIACDELLEYIDTYEETMHDR